MKTGTFRNASIYRRGVSHTLTLTVLLSATACTHVAKLNHRQNVQLEEHSRALTTAVVDTLHLQPTEQRDEFTTVALELAQHDQRIEGMPLNPIAAADLLGVNHTNRTAAETIAEQKAARNDLTRRFAQIEQLRAKQKRSENQLLEFGERFEQQRNEQRTRWLRRGLAVALSVGAIVALAFFVPASIPLLGRLLAFCVGRFPALAGAAGVVSVKAFDAVVKAIEHAKSAAASESSFVNQHRPEFDRAELDYHLSREMDAAHKDLVRARKAALHLLR